MSRTYGERLLTVHLFDEEDMVTVADSEGHPMKRVDHKKITNAGVESVSYLTDATGRRFALGHKRVEYRVYRHPRLARAIEDAEIRDEIERVEVLKNRSVFVTKTRESVRDNKQYYLYSSTNGELLVSETPKGLEEMIVAGTGESRTLLDEADNAFVTFSADQFGSRWSLFNHHALSQARLAYLNRNLSREPFIQESSQLGDALRGGASYQLWTENCGDRFVELRIQRFVNEHLYEGNLHAWSKRHELTDGVLPEEVQKYYEQLKRVRTIDGDESNRMISERVTYDYEMLEERIHALTLLYEWRRKQLKN